MLSFITDFFGPIFAKEMIEMSRRWRYYQNRIIFGAIVLLVLFTVYQEYRYLYDRSGGWTLQTLSKMAEVFFLSYLWVQYLAVFLFTPFFLTGVIAGEREQKTLDLLFTTQLGNREIVFGKLGSRIVSLLMLVLSGVPIVAMTMLFGGVNAQVFLHALIATMLAILYAGSMAIYFSTTTKTTLGALVRTYWWMICWLFIVPLLLVMSIEAWFFLFASRSGPGASQAYIWWQEVNIIVICILNPLASFIIGVSDFFAARIAPVLGAWYFYYLLIIPALWSLLMIALAIRNVRREPKPGKATTSFRKVLNGIVSIIILKPLTSRLLKLLPASKAERWLWFPVSNPLWLRARRAWVYDREQHLQRAQVGGWILAILVLVLLATVESSFFRHRESVMLFTMWVWLGLAISACLVAGISIINDRRRGFFEFVLVTPLEHWEVVIGVFQSVWRHIKKVYLLLVVLMLFFAVMTMVSLLNAFLSVLLGSLAIMLLVMHGIACSLVARSTAVALISTFSFGLLILFLPPLLSGMFHLEGTGVLYVLCFILLPLAWLLTRWRKNAFTVTFFLTMFHFSLVCLFTCWVGAIPNLYDAPLMSIHPGVHIMEPIRDESYGPSQRFHGAWPSVQVMYGAALLLNMVFIWWWICRHYEVLSGRREQGKKSKGTTTRKPVPVLPPIDRATVATKMAVGAESPGNGHEG